MPLTGNPTASKGQKRKIAIECWSETAKAQSVTADLDLGKEADMRLSIRRNKGKAEIRLELGDFAITLEIPV
jgi:hypothetical protein